MLQEIVFDFDEFFNTQLMPFAVVIFIVTIKPEAIEKNSEASCESDKDSNLAILHFFLLF